jgi:drug/metabolite transporter (DMT)-like permease
MNRTKGVLLTILAASSFGFIPLFAKIAYVNGFNPYTFTLFRSIFASIELFILLKIRKIDYTLGKEQYITLFKVSLIGYSSAMLTLSLSYNYMSTGLATIIHFIYPVAVMVGTIFFFNEKIDKRIIFSLILSLTGMYFLVGFGSLESTSIVGILLSLFSGIFYAYYIIIVAHGNVREIDSFVLIFYISLFNSCILFVISIFMGKLETNFTFKGIVSSRFKNN